MVKSLFLKLKNKPDLQTLLVNFFSLYLNNAVTYLVPIIVIPYLLRVIGVEHYGYFVFAFTFATYFRILIDFGFDISVTKQIVIHKSDNQKLSEIFSVVFFSRLIFFAISAILFLIIVNFVPLAQKVGTLFFALTFLYIISSVISVNAFFYAFGEVKYSTIANGIGKFLYLISLIIFVKSEQDYLYVALLSSFSWIIPSLILLILGIRRYKLKLQRPRFLQNIALLKEAKNAFASDLAVSFYSTTNVMLLGLVAPANVLGIYASLEKIYSALSSLLSSSNYVLYPRLIAYFQSGGAVLLAKLKKFELIYLSISMGLAGLMYLAKPFVINYLFKGSVPYSEEYYLLFSVAIILSPFGSLYTRCFLILSKSNILMRITSLGFIVNATTAVLILYVFKMYYLIPLSIIATQIYIVNTKRALVMRNLRTGTSVPVSN